MWTSLANMISRMTFNKLLFKKMSVPISRSYSLTHANISHAHIIDISSNFERAVSLAAKLIQDGYVIAAPSDTVYGLAVNSQNTSAIMKLYDLKDRDISKPLAISVADISDIKLWSYVDVATEALLLDLLPGPVTVVLKRKEELNPYLNEGLSNIAIRIPNNNFMRSLSSLLNLPIALTSANKSGDPSCVSIDEFKHLWPSLAAVFDGGVIGNSRTGSTIIDLTQSRKYSILRSGAGVEHIKKILSKHNVLESEIY